MIFFPLFPRIVCANMAGTIVERRDPVLITFFSLRVFSPSTFSRKWPSTNGPFFSERPIDPLFLHSTQAAPLSPPHFLKSPHRPRHAMRPGAEGANEARALRVRNALHDHSPSGLAQLVQHRLRRNDYRLQVRAHRLGSYFRCLLLCRALRP